MVLLRFRPPAGPSDSTNVLQFCGYKKSFAEGMVGAGSAVSVLVFFLALLFALLYIRALGVRVLKAR